MKLVAETSENCMQNKVREINNEKRFLREKPSKLFSFSPKESKQQEHTKKKRL
jgi:hypothetical protein